MYGPLNLINNNFITDYSQIIPTTQATGRITHPWKVGNGVALLDVLGAFAGAFDLDYVVEIDSIAGGAEVGQATFRWRNSSLAPGVWAESGILTRTDPPYPLSADGLGTDLEVSFIGRVGTDFALNDSWYWSASATYGTQRLLDLDRMTGWRSTSPTAQTLTITLPSAQLPTICILQDHNFTSAATITLKAAGPPAYNYTWPVITDPLYVYLDYSTPNAGWTIEIDDPTNPDGYVEFAELYLGDFTRLEKVNGVWGTPTASRQNLQSNVSTPGRQRRYFYATQRSLDLQFGNTLSNEDIATLEALQASLIDPETNRVNPFWVHLFEDEPETLKLMDWENINNFGYQYFRYLWNSGAILSLLEAAKV